MEALMLEHHKQHTPNLPREFSFSRSKIIIYAGQASPDIIAEFDDLLECRPVLVILRDFGVWLKVTLVRNPCHSTAYALT